ncbi:MAG: ATP-binding protein [Gemmatimonadota bacterium]
MTERNAPVVADADSVSGESPAVRVRAPARGRTINEYLIQMSNELRTPLNAIIGMSGLIVESDADSKRQYAKGIYLAGETLSAILNDLLDLARLAENTLSVEPIRFDLRSMVEETAKTLTPRAEDRGLTLRVDWRPDVPRQVVGDPGRIRQVLGNLVGHALHATSRGEVVIQVAADGGADATTSVVFSVVDTGVGIPASRMERVFDEYVPVDASPYRSFCVTGLGLRISSDLVRLMGGEIGAASEMERGSTFWFSLPLIAATTPADDAATRAPGAKGGRALVVEHDPLSRERFANQVEAAGWRIEFVEELSQVIALLQSARQSGDSFGVCLLSDYAVRPAHEELARRIKSDTGLEQVALVMLTAVGSPGEGKRLWHAGFAAYLRKPVPNDELGETLQALEQIGPDGRGPSLITRHSLAEAKSAQHLQNDDGIEDMLASLWLDSVDVPVEGRAPSSGSTESILPSDPESAAEEISGIAELLLTGPVVERDHDPAPPEPEAHARLMIDTFAIGEPDPAGADEMVSEEGVSDSISRMAEDAYGLFGFEGNGAPSPAPAEGLLTGWELARDHSDGNVGVPGLITLGESMLEDAPQEVSAPPPRVEATLFEPEDSEAASLQDVTGTVEPEVEVPNGYELEADRRDTVESEPQGLNAVESAAHPPEADADVADTVDPVESAAPPTVPWAEAIQLEVPVLPPLAPVRVGVEPVALVHFRWSGLPNATESVVPGAPPTPFESALPPEADPVSASGATLEAAPTSEAGPDQEARPMVSTDLTRTTAEAEAEPTASVSAAALECSEPPQKQPVVSEAILEQLTRGGSSLATQLVATFLREAPARISEVATSANRGDLPRARQALASLKTMCGLLGAIQLSDAVEVAHRAAESGDIGPVGGELGRIEQAFLEVRLAVEEATPTDESGEAPAPIDGGFLEQLRSGAGARRPTMITRLAEKFLADTPTWMTELDLAVRKEDAAAVQRLAQMLKATATIIGAQGLATLGDQIQASAQLVRFDEVRDGVTRARLETARVSDALRNSM